MTPEEEEILMLKAMVYSIVKRYGTNMNIELRGINHDTLPAHLTIGWNLVGDDAIVTVLTSASEGPSKEDK